MKLSNSIQNALNEMGYHSLLPIQEKVIPMIQDGKSLFVLAKTGSGKTASYLIPAIEQVQESDDFTSVLIIAPTRELAIQISLEAKLLASYTKVHIVTLIGGMDSNQQLNALRHHPHIIIGTPGRLLDLYTQGAFDLSKLSLFIIDEADQVYSTGQSEEVNQLRKEIQGVQTICLSATKNDTIQTYFDTPFEEVLQGSVAVNEKISSYYLETENKKDTLLSLLQSLPITSAIVFVNHRSTAIELSDLLLRNNILSSAFSGYFDERKRIAIMSDFRKGDIRVLVATDAAARGLDIHELSHVIHYDIPIDTETFIHRSGRTAHQGDDGISISLLTPEDMKSEVGMYIRMHSQAYTAQDTQPIDLSIPYQKKATPSTQVTHILIRAGRNDKIRPKDIIGALCTIFSFDEIGTLEIQDRFSTVTILSKEEDILSRFEDFTVKGKRRKVELLNQ